MIDVGTESDSRTCAVWMVNGMAGWELGGRGSQVQHRILGVSQRHFMHSPCHFPMLSHRQGDPRGCLVVRVGWSCVGSLSVFLPRHGNWRRLRCINSVKSSVSKGGSPQCTWDDMSMDCINSSKLDSGWHAGRSSVTADLIL